MYYLMIAAEGCILLWDKYGNSIRQIAVHRQGLPDFLATITSQMLWPLTTTYYGGQRPEIASL